MYRSARLAVALCLAGGIACAQQGNPGANFVTQWDQDGDGKVTLPEATQKRGDIFTMFDADENGVLSDPEYATLDETRAADMAANAEASGMGQAGHGMMNAGMDRGANDANNDGMVSRDEFVGMTPDWFAMMDRTGDSLITADDFGRN